MSQLHRFSKNPAVRRLTQNQTLLHALIQQGRGDIAIEILVKHRDQAPHFRPFARAAPKHRQMLNGFLNIFADCAAITQGDACLRVMQNRSAASRIERP